MLTVRYRWLGLAPGQRLLDFGCGGGRHALEAMRLGAVATAVDSDGHAVVGDGRALPFPDSCFDKVIAAEVIEHVPDDAVVLAELARVLRGGGTLAVTVPRWFPEVVNWALSSEYHNVPGGHVRIYRRAQLRRRLRGAGLVPGRAHHAHALHSPYWWLRCALGISREDNRLVRAYHRLLVWDMTAKNPFARWPEALLNPVLGKSLVIYARKPVIGEP
jgi:SAM-dependent methyltransferase